MDCKSLVFALVALPFFADLGAAASRLSDTQMDKVTGGQVLGIECAGCTLASSNSMSTNGLTTSMSSTGATPGGGNTGGGSGSGGGGTGNGSTEPSGLTSAPAVPANVSAILSAATTTTISMP